MNASKENGRKAMKIAESVNPGDDMKFVFEFIEAAIRKLPSEASYAKEKSRKRNKVPAKFRDDYLG